MTFKHGGHVRDLARQAGCKAEELLDFSANINPLGPPDCLRQVISRHLNEVTHYPDPHCLALRRAIASMFSVPVEQVVCGNGSTELLYALPKALGVHRAVIPIPSYIDYIAGAARARLQITTVSLGAESGFSVDWERIEQELSGSEMVIAGQPGNPSGAMFDPAALLDLADRHLSTFFIVDEAFADFVAGYRSLAFHGHPNIIVLRSMTKFYAIPGLRLGYAIAPEPLAERISEVLPPWSVGSLAQVVGVAVLQDDAYAEKTREEVARLREQLHRGLVDLGAIEVFPAAANYLLARLDRADLDAPELARRLLTRRIAIRVCGNYEDLDERYFRVAVRTEEENGRLLDAMAEVMGPSARTKARPAVKSRRTPAVMFQGTASNAGKSVLAAAFCRILLQDGYRVAPFKAQNMSLNSFVTRDGGEMGRAQVLQAQACRFDPDVRMNPVLLKPNSDTGSQVIVLGKPVGNMDVNAYIEYKPQAFEAVKQAYASLASEVDAMVIEGAGSPGEVNLKDHDIVNMAMAAVAKAPVLLVGDIDRGGVFASFVGTLEVLSERERAMVAGFVINRFRGNQALLKDAIEYVQRHTGRPAFGVIPYIRDLGLPEEDSVSFKALKQNTPPSGADQVEIALIDIPHISNFTDFDPFGLEQDVCLRIVRKAGQLGSPDAVMIPGSKNVPGDLAYLHDSGLAERIVELGRKGVTIVGICGGMQMLGKKIEDPHGIESEGAVQQGLALLPIRTVLESTKTLRLVSARHPESGLTLKGYEIHHGCTAGDGLSPAIIGDDGNAIGFSSEDGCVTGTYLHGMYDNDAFRRWFIDRLRTRRGLAAVGVVRIEYDLEPALDRLADIVRANLDVDAIYQRMGLK